MNQTCGRCRQSKDQEEYSPSYRGKAGTWCRACFAEYNRHRERGTKPSDPVSAGRVVNCEYCKAAFAPRYDRPSRPNRFCSQECKVRHCNDREAEERREAKPERACQWCGTAMAKNMRSDAVFCSAECNEQAHRRTRAYRRRGGTGARPRKQPLVNLAALAQRDSFCCSLCGKRIDLTLKYPDPLFPTVDHVVPLAHGGDPLDPANCRVAHLTCNASRGKRGGDEQLRLIG